MKKKWRKKKKEENDFYKSFGKKRKEENSFFKPAGSTYYKIGGRNSAASGLIVQVIYIVNKQKSIDYLRIYAKSFPSPYRSKIDARKNKLQLGTVQGNPGRLRRNQRHLKSARFQTLVKNPVAVAIPEKQFDLIPAAIVKNKQRAVHSFTAKVIPDFAA
jgi:hypothetical protein